MSDNSSNKRIAKNTIFLYLRMMMVMGVALYTSRVILNILGASDYGIYNVVGGIVTMVSFLNGAIAASTSRFLTFALGEGVIEKQKNIFSACFTLHCLIALLVLILGETVGLCFFYNKMVIPDDRLTAAFWVYQFSIISTMVSFTQVPYNATLIAHEKMSIYAYVGLYEAISKLCIVYLLAISPIDKLIFYALLLLINGVGIMMFYRWYENKHFEECSLKIVKDKHLYKQLLGYGGWDLFGNFAVICQGQGMNILLNLFFGPVVNAARAIAYQVQGAITQFVSNFMTAVRPQTIKSYAEGNPVKMYTLTFYAAKFSYLLMLALTLPICFEINYILTLWLGDAIPEDTAIFTVLVLVYGNIRTFQQAALMPYHAIGKIKAGNLIAGTIMIMTLPVSYILLKFGCPAFSVFIAIIAVEVITSAIVWYLIHSYEQYSYVALVKKVFAPVLVITFITIVPPILLRQYMEEGLLRLIILTLITESTLLLSTCFIALTSSERMKIIQIIKSKNKNK